jgi:uncharacterized protein involved in exopolysaccharide biosynthesis
VIAGRRHEVEQLVALEPRYVELRESVERARENYDLLQSKYTEAVLKESTIKNATYIQVVEPAIAPSQPAPSKHTSLMVLALAGSLGLGIVLAFAANYIIGLAAVRPPVAAPPLARSPHQTQKLDQEVLTPMMFDGDKLQRLKTQ